jgi:hypothetical protein
MVSFPRSPKLLKGALVRLGEGFLGPIPNIIVFQYNPEKFSRQFKFSENAKVESNDKDPAKKTGAASTAEPFDPVESFNLTLELDAADALEDPEGHPIEAITGIADRIAAIEMLTYPMAKDPTAPPPAQQPGGSSPVPKNKVPVVLFIWGPGRILPVRITSISIEEQAFSPTLFPIRATVNLGLTVLNENSFIETSGSNLTVSEKLAVGAYKYTKGLKEGLARANLLNSGASLLGMLPF